MHARDPGGRPVTTLAALLGILTVLCAAGPAARGAAAAAVRADVIADFDGGAVALTGYPDQDLEPDAWELTAANTHGGSAYALRLYGNTWKRLAIPPRAVADTTVWQVAVYCETRGEMQAFGLGDGSRELVYTFHGTQLPAGPDWWTVYQGSHPGGEWRVFLLPVGTDWRATHGDLPAVTELVFVNDDDEGLGGAVLFDTVADVSADLPVAPRATILYTPGAERRTPAGKRLVAVQFQALVDDPDGGAHAYLWDFGDGACSEEEDPAHDFEVASDHTYTVSLVVEDEDGLHGHAACQVEVDPGPAGPPVTVNLVGDVFTGRTYEQPGGIIDTQGIEALFTPTLPILGEAADLSVVNMEVCYTDQGTPHPTKSVVFRSRPENIVGLPYAGVDLVNIANNHIIDYGEVGMVQCLGLLDGLKLPRCGAGVDATRALEPAFLSERGVRLGFVGLSNRCGRTWNYQPFLDAGCDKPGFAYLLPHNLAAAIDGARPHADVVIVQLHSGDEYETAPPAGKAAGAVPPPVEAAEIRAGDPEVRFKVEPSPGDRALRRLAVDLGADVVINHHPHVLQGFESYAGRLIAHSLGNFVFDLYYPETMPTIVLTLEVEKEGIVGYTLAPAFIDDDIPQPASGRLAREILDRLADYSRPMGALVAVRPIAGRARIFLDRAGADSTVTSAEAATALVEQDGWRTSPPVALAGEGSLSRLVGAAGDAAGGWEVRWGRELLWHGGFEAEGATLWDVNTADEWLDDTVAHGGARSLTLRRDEHDTGQTGTDLERHLPCDPARAHSACGWLRTQNGADARIMVRDYSSRYSESPLLDVDLGPRLSGDHDWTWQWRDLDTPGGAIYFELRCGLEPPASGEGRAWFDDLALIEWEAWQAADAPLPVAAPNNLRFLQVRTAAPATWATVSYEETAYDPDAVSGSGSTPPSRRALRLRSFPNPFNPRTTLELTIPGDGRPVPVQLAVYDLRGRRVSVPFRGSLASGSRHGIAWNGEDGAGRPLASGTYLARAVAGGRTARCKLLLIR